MHVALPSRFGVEEVYSFLDSVLETDGSPRSLEYDFDFSALGFILPEGVVALANVLKYLLSKSCSVRLVGCHVDERTSKNSPLRYLDDCLFFELFLGYKLADNSAPRETTLPLQFLDTERYYSWVFNKVVPWLDRQLVIDTQRQLPELPACLDELFNNIIDHAQVPAASVHMQHFPASNEVLIAVADFGVGIPVNIRSVPDFSGLTDAQCLEKSIEPGVSSKTTPRNRGAGLDTLIQNVIVHNRGRIDIRSLKGHLAITPSGREPVFRAMEKGQKYPGTLFFITLRTDTIPAPDEGEEAFIWD